MNRRNLLKKTAGFAIILLALSGFNSVAYSADFYVAPSGNDVNPGTVAKPVATLERASQIVRQMRKKNPSEAITVWLKRGTYSREATFTLSAMDSGSEKVPIVYSACKGERVLLTGGRILDKAWFKKSNDNAVLSKIIDEKARSLVWEVDLKAHGIADYGENQKRGFGQNDFKGTAPMQLYIGGARMVLARWPNPDESYPQNLKEFVKNRKGVVGRAGVVDVGPVAGDADYRKRGETFKYSFDRADKWVGAPEIWLDGIFNESWEWSYNRVAKIDPVKKTITLSYGESGGLNDKYSSDFFFAENLLEELDRPGEYWIDRVKGKLYLIPPESFSSADSQIMVTMLGEPMLKLRNVSNVIFRDLEMSYGRGDMAEVKGGEGVRFERCFIRDFSGNAVMLNGKAHGVSACRFLRVGGTAVGINAGDNLKLMLGACYVEDCEIKECAWYNRVYNPAVRLAGVGNRVSHNHISDLPHVAIHMTGNDQLVEYNEISKVCDEFTDMGAIYVYTGDQPYMRGNVVRGNYIHDMGRLSMQNGVYPDNGTMGVTIEGNIFLRIGDAAVKHPSRAINNNSCAYIVTRNNIFIDCVMPYLMSAHSGGANHDKQKVKWEDFFKEHPLQTLPHIAKYPEMKNFWQEDRRYPTTNPYERNVVWNPTRPLVVPQNKGKKKKQILFADGATEDYAGLIKTNNWTATVDPGFINATNNDYTLKAGAEVFKQIPGFKAIPFKEIGPRIVPGPKQ